MAMSPFERDILAALKEELKNPKLKEKDLLEWANREVKAQEGEIIIQFPKLGIWVATKKENDQREGKQ